MVYLLVLLTSALLIRATHRARQPNLAAFIVACWLATFVALRGPDISNDFIEYQEWYRIGTQSEGVLERPPLLESLFFAGMTLSSEAGLPFRIFLWVVALGAISLKLYSIRRIAVTRTGLWAGTACYLFSGFLLHEFTQLRAGLAIACFMLSLVFLSERRVWAYLAAIFVAALIHSAALLGLAALPLSRLRRGWLDVALLGMLALAALGRARGVFSLERMAELFGSLDARLALYMQFASSGVSEPVEPFSVRTVLVLLLILMSYAALVRQDRLSAPALVSADRTGPSSVALLTLLRLIVLGQLALFLFADVREVAVRVMEFWMACLPLYAVHLAQTRGMRLPSLILWLWLAATFGNYVFRTPTLVGPYSIGL
ncbi:EpsG family protein [Rivibacter subsaxonicus]|uniref:EpsG-like putative glucosyltransferase n=1 Tax=Rivibacter subsaxonicus TaxID=457575 RepID=A0A4Q7VGR8_9BURK|nr:EpsG family protein [Rivibacter subsaxonicus]RZT95240.1 EpsG-like putative glucosyltransferase [Rivibacter subsaxonicus]